MQRTLIRKTSLLRKIEPIARRSSFANKNIYNSLVPQASACETRERRNDLEIMMERTISCTTQLGSISSLRCQKTRSAHSIANDACELMFRGR